MFKRVPGTKDIFPTEVSRWQRAEEVSRAIFSLYNYREARTPVIEEAGLFNRSLGESSDIVQKQMFLIRNKEDLYVLRPEGTASLVRAYLENQLDKTLGLVKFYYIGPMFRLERPQKGRLRQFHHIGAEIIGSSCPAADVEIIALADKLLAALGISGQQIVINNLGCSKDRNKLTEILRNRLKDKLSGLCADCRVRFKHNVLRILDCKNQACQEAIARLDINDNYLCQDCQTHFRKVREGLDNLKIEYQVNPLLVRGLDYYTRTVFEIRHAGLGSQDALGAGGRYDNLVKELGGPDIGALGFALGIERLLLAQGPESAVQGKGLVYVIALGDEAEKKGMKLLDNLRKNGIASDRDYETKSLKGAMRRANDLHAGYVVIIGEDELKKNAVTLKDMASGGQREVKYEDLIKEVKC